MDELPLKPIVKEYVLKHSTLTLLTSALLFIAAEPAQAQEKINLNGKDVAVGKNEIVFQVSGLVCSFCSYGLQKGLSKLGFVDKDKFTKGVFTDIDHQYTVVAVKEGSSADIESARKVITDAGYEVLHAFRNPTGKALEKTSFEKVKK